MATSYAPPTTMSDLRDYVAGPHDSGFAARAESTVLLHVSHSHLRARFPEIRLDLHMTVEDVKHKVCAMTGSSAQASQLQLLDSSGRVVAPSLGGDGTPSRKLGYYGARTGWRLHLLDHDERSLAATGWLEDTSKVEKYVMADEEYDRREGTYRSYRRQRLAEDPTWTLEGEMKARRAALAAGKAAGGGGGAEGGQEGQGAGACCGTGAAAGAGGKAAASSAAGISVGDRCSVAPGDRRGIIAFVGPAPDLGPGDWVGVAYDEPVGKHDGVPKPGAARLFSCAPRHGGVLRPDRVAVGDFPPVGLSDGEGEGDESSDLGSGDEI